MLHPNPLFRQILGPLSVHYDDPATVEIRMSRPGEVVTVRRGEGKRIVEDKGLPLAVIESILVSYTHLTLPRNREVKLVVTAVSLTNISYTRLPLLPIYLLSLLR